MSENWAIGLVLFILGQAAILIAGGVVAHVNLLGKIGGLAERMMAIEVRNEGADRHISRMAHSPHDPYGWDASIDKYLDRYYEMTSEEWEEWLHKCEAVIADETKPRDDRKTAVLLAAICSHKLMIPPPRRREIEKTAALIEGSIKSKPPVLK